VRFVIDTVTEILPSAIKSVADRRARSVICFLLVERFDHRIAAFNVSLCLRFNPDCDCLSRQAISRSVRERR